MSLKNKLAPLARASTDILDIAAKRNEVIGLLEQAGVLEQLAANTAAILAAANSKPIYDAPLRAFWLIP